MDAAEKFAKESGLNPTAELASIRDRMMIRTAIQTGKIDEAIERINHLDPEVRLFYITIFNYKLQLVKQDSGY